MGSSSNESVTAWAEPPSSDDGWGIGDVVGRYVLREKLGAGGMGVVHAAHDRDLDRQVAIKLLRAGIEEQTATAQARLRREGRSLAQISHPNIVTVFDVGVHADRVFIAMEFVRGRTLSSWAQEAQRSWREILAKLLAAGRGIAAAHAAGVVHRDIKPANILVGDDDRTRVVDFGLAQARFVTESPEPTQLWSFFDSGDETSVLTADGVLVGTPAYMAPEQFRSHVADEHCDQYAFCLTAFRVLYDRRPFPLGNYKRIGMAKLSGRIPTPPPGSPVPDAVYQVLRRGLRLAPSERYPAMIDLLQALERASTRRSRRPWVAAAAGGLVGAGMAFPQVTDAGPGRCEGGDAAWAQAWNSQGRARIEASLQQLGGTLSQQTWTRVQESLARYGDQWKRSYRDACEATDRDAAERDRTMACLHAARTSVSALSEGLAEADRRVLVRAVEAAHALPDPASCLDAPVVGEPRAVGPQAESLALELAWVEASVEAGVFPDEAIDRVERRARSVGDPRLLARTLLLRGRALADAGDEAAALERLEQAQYTAEAAGDDRTLLRAVTELIYLRGHVRRQPEAALGLEGLARATLARMGDPDDTRGRLLNAIGNALEAQKKFEDAQAVYTEALEVLGRAHGREGADVARTLNNLGNAALRQGKPDEARAFYERARSTWSDALGADHPDAVMPMANLAVIQLRQGQLSEGREALRVVLGSWEQAYGLTHRKLLMPLQNLAIVSRNLQDFEAALDYDRRNVEVATAVYGPDHEHVARALQGMATTLRHLERFDEAADRARQAAAIYEMVLGPDHPDLSFVYTELAKTQVHLPEADKAVEYARRAQQIDAAHFGSDSPENGPNEYTLAHVLNELGRFAEAEPVARAAIASYADSELDPENLAASHWELAKALRGQGKAASPVQAQATQAIEIYRAAEHETEATQVEAWLAAG